MALVITLEALGLRWLSPGDASEICVHGEVDFRIDDAVLLVATAPPSGGAARPALVGASVATAPPSGGAARPALVGASVATAPPSGGAARPALVGASDAAGPAFTVSAAALYLLRTLSVPHTAAAPVGERLFPCCGFCVYDTGGPDVVIAGCPNGRDFEVEHLETGEGVAVLTAAGRLEVSWHDWRAAVFGFADQISRFFAAAPARQPTEIDRDGYRKLCAEWKRRRGRALGE